MTVQETKLVGQVGVSRGALDVHGTVVRGVVDFDCGCGKKIIIQIRKELKEDSQYQFEIIHGSRRRTMNTDDPNALSLFDRMWSVSSKNYVKCRFPKRKILM